MADTGPGWDRGSGEGDNGGESPGPGQQEDWLLLQLRDHHRICSQAFCALVSSSVTWRCDTTSLTQPPDCGVEMMLHPGWPAHCSKNLVHLTLSTFAHAIFPPQNVPSRPPPFLNPNSFRDPGKSFFLCEIVPDYSSYSVGSLLATSLNIVGITNENVIALYWGFSTSVLLTF